MAVHASLQRRYTAEETRTGAHQRGSAASVKVITAAVAFGAHILSTFTEFLLRAGTSEAKEETALLLNQEIRRSERDDRSVRISDRSGRGAHASSLRISHGAQEKAERPRLSTRTGIILPRETAEQLAYQRQLLKPIPAALVSDSQEHRTPISTSDRHLPRRPPSSDSELGARLPVISEHLHPSYANRTHDPTSPLGR